MKYLSWVSGYRFTILKNRTLSHGAGKVIFLNPCLKKLKLDMVVCAFNLSIRESEAGA